MVVMVAVAVAAAAAAAAAEWGSSVILETDPLPS